ncbi:hypothetical protein [Chryseobacterium gambrini]|uniref:hypothetical protein n=1 Tax=Chryseobacterium gambrini TaxID=373672 RepID=UPI0025B478FA|nr:hypothetical protein [Chryseobacterium gambrini]MDN4031855.1 hypothetical protein [Chryseobacterium gambrini]
MMAENGHFCGNFTPFIKKTSFKNKQKKTDFQKFSHANKSTQKYTERNRSPHQPTTNNHQPTTINHQSSIINHQSSIINHQPTTNNHQPSTINQQQSIINHQSSTNPKPTLPSLLPLINIFRSSFLQKK